jgi:hypothetical protein
MVSSQGEAPTTAINRSSIEDTCMSEKLVKRKHIAKSSNMKFGMRAPTNANA